MHKMPPFNLIAQHDLMYLNVLSGRLRKQQVEYEN